MGEDDGTDNVSGDLVTDTAITLFGDLTGDAGAQVMNVPAAGETKTLEVNELMVKHSKYQQMLIGLLLRLPHFVQQ